MNRGTRTKTHADCAAHGRPVQQSVDVFQRQAAFDRFQIRRSSEIAQSGRRQISLRFNTQPPQSRSDVFTVDFDRRFQRGRLFQSQPPRPRHIGIPRQQSAESREIYAVAGCLRFDFHTADHVVSVFGRVKRQINGHFVFSFTRKSLRRRQSVRHVFHVVEKHVACEFGNDKRCVIFFRQQKFGHFRLGSGRAGQGNRFVRIVRIAQNQIEFVLILFILRLNGAGFFGGKRFDFHRPRCRRLSVFEQEIGQNVLTRRRRAFDFGAADGGLEQFGGQILIGKQRKQSPCFPNIESDVSGNVALVPVGQTVFARKSKRRLGRRIDDAQGNVRGFVFAELVRFERKTERCSHRGDVAFKKERPRCGIGQQFGVHVFPDFDGRVFVAFDFDGRIRHQHAVKPHCGIAGAAVEKGGLPVPFAVRQTFQRQFRIFQNNFFDMDLTFERQSLIKQKFGGLRLQNLRESPVLNISQRNFADFNHRRRRHRKLRRSLNPQRKPRLFAHLRRDFLDITVPIVVRRHDEIQRPARQSEKQKHNQQKLFQCTPPLNQRVFVPNRRSPASPSPGTM